jgi:hypothetical protein
MSALHGELRVSRVLGRAVQRRDVRGEVFLPGVEDENRVGRRLDWTPADADNATFERMGEDAEVEKRALVRFALFTALRDRRVTPREVSIVEDSDGNNDNEDEVEVGKKVWICVGQTQRRIPIDIQTQT